MVLTTRIDQNSIDKLTVAIHQSICDLNKTKGSESIVVYYAVFAIDTIDGAKSGDGHVKFYLDELAAVMNREEWKLEKQLRGGYKRVLLDNGRYVATKESFYHYLTIRKNSTGRKLVTVIYKSPQRILIDRGRKDPGSVIVVGFNQLTRVQELREITTYGNAQLAQARSEHKMIDSNRGLWNVQKNVPDIKPRRKVLKVKQLLEEIKSFDQQKDSEGKVSRENQANATRTVNYTSTNRVFLFGLNHKVGASQQYIAHLSGKTDRTMRNRLSKYKDSIYQQYIPVDVYENFNIEQRCEWNSAMHRILTARPDGTSDWRLPLDRAWKDVVNATDEQGNALFKGFYVTYSGNALECYRPYCNLYEEIYEDCKRYKFVNKFNRYVRKRNITVDTADVCIDRELINVGKNRKCSFDEEFVNSIEF